MSLEGALVALHHLGASPAGQHSVSWEHHRAYSEPFAHSQAGLQTDTSRPVPRAAGSKPSTLSAWPLA